jgi:hypothetical protein
MTDRIIKRCYHCGSKKIDRGYYSRGWNNLCNQASGDYGYWCYDCCKVSFIKTLDEYKATLPKWCESGLR